jgi:hypothetical protein
VPLSFFFFPTDKWDPHIGLPSFIFFTFSPQAPPRTAPHRPPRATAARERMGRPGHRASAHTELARAPVTQSEEFRRGEFPLLPSLGDTKGARAATRGWPRRRPSVSSIRDAPATILPLRRLERDPEGDHKTLAAPHQPAWRQGGKS